MPDESPGCEDFGATIEAAAVMIDLLQQIDQLRGRLKQAGLDVDSARDAEGDPDQGWFDSPSHARCRCVRWYLISL